MGWIIGIVMRGGIIVFSSAEYSGKLSKGAGKVFTDMDFLMLMKISFLWR